MQPENRSRTRLLITILSLAIVALVAINALALASVAVSPPRCDSCHTAESASLEKRDHASVSCESCHVPQSADGRVRFAVDTVYGMYLPLREFSGREVSGVSNETCAKCHKAVNDGVVGTALRINHATCSVESSCTDCHSRTAHGDDVEWQRTYDMFECLSCHMRTAAKIDCNTCHTDRSPKERILSGTFAVSHSANWRQTHGMGDALACGACHTSEKCGKCHGVGVPHPASFRTVHGRVASSKDAKCQSCHSEDFCSDCHGVQMPHPPSFKPQHSAIVKKDGRASCDKCHAKSDCTTCHEMHVHPGGARESQR